MFLFMLEDDADRIKQFESAVLQLHASIDFRHWRTALGFISGVVSTQREPQLICLDHDWIFSSWLPLVKRLLAL